MSTPPVDQQHFLQEVTSRFGLVPSFFSSSEEAPEMIERLWDFAKAAYLDNPIPSLFKERLFVYLSRFCEVRYCITRHCAFLLGFGHAAGDPLVHKQTLQEVVALLKMPPPWQLDVEEIFKPLEALAKPSHGRSRERQPSTGCSSLQRSFSSNLRARKERVEA